MTYFIYVLGTCVFVYRSGGFILRRLIDFDSLPRFHAQVQCFFVGLFTYLVTNFLVLNYIPKYWQIPWFETVKFAAITFAIFSVFKFVWNVRTYSKSSLYIGLFNRTNRLALFLSLFFIAFWLLLSLLFVFENDALEYYGISRHIETLNSLVNYPPTNTSWLNPLYAPSTHPPYFHIFLSLFAPSFGTFTGVRLLILAMCVGMFILVLDRSKLRYGFLLAASVPLFVFGVQGLSIEAFRLPFFTAGLLLILYKAPSDTKIKIFFRLMIGFGMIITPHSLGLLMAFLILVAFYVIWKDLKLLMFQLIAGGCSLLCTSPQYFLNLVAFGSPFQDSTPILDKPSIRFYEDLLIRRELGSLSDFLINGSLRPAIDFTLFGFTFLLGITISLGYLFKERKNLEQQPLASMSAVIILLFTALQVLTGLIEQELLIKNVRYALSIFPLIVVVITHELRSLQDE